MTALALVAACALNVQVPGRQAESTLVHSPVTGEVVNAAAATIDFKGIRYMVNSKAEKSQFVANPDQCLASPKLSVLLVGVDQFDPVTGVRVDLAHARGGYSDVASTRYWFATAVEKTQFDADPTKFDQIPPKEALVDATTKMPLSGYADAGAYVDCMGVRYYLKSADSIPTFQAAEQTLAARIADKVTDPKAVVLGAAYGSHG